MKVTNIHLIRLSKAATIIFYVLFWNNVKFRVEKFTYTILNLVSNKIFFRILLKGKNLEFII